jgi:PadR family transcriptional regulator, regulatory protein PadR
MLKGHLNLLILAVLQAQPAHGYVIIEELRRHSEGTFDLPEGTVYPALHQLELDGLVTSEWSGETKRRRRVYELTERGRAALAAQQQEWDRFSRGVEAVLRETRPTEAVPQEVGGHGRSD